MPTTFISNDETNEPTNSSAEGPIMMTPSNTLTDKPQRLESEGITTDFMVNPTVIPSDDQDEPLLKSDHAALMRLHEQPGHSCFAQLKQMSEQGIIPRKLAKVPPPKFPSYLYRKAHRKPRQTHMLKNPYSRFGLISSCADQFNSWCSPMLRCLFTCLFHNL